MKDNWNGLNDDEVEEDTYLKSEGFGTWKEQKRKKVDFMTAINSGKRIKGEKYSDFYDANEYLKHTLELEDINGTWEIE